MGNGCSECNNNNNQNEVIKLNKDEIIRNASKSVCKITYTINDENHNQPGFFLKAKYNNKTFKYLIISCQVAQQKLKKKTIKLELYNKNKTELPLESRKFFCNNDIIAIQITNEDKNIIDVVEFLNYDKNISDGYEEFKNKEVFAFGYRKGMGLIDEKGEIIEINKNEFKHNIQTDEGFPGSPIILFFNSKVIGVHKCRIKSKNVNKGTFIGVIIDALNDNKLNDSKYSKEEEQSRMNEDKKENIKSKKGGKIIEEISNEETDAKTEKNMNYEKKKIEMG